MKLMHIAQVKLMHLARVDSFVVIQNQQFCFSDNSNGSCCLFGHVSAKHTPQHVTNGGVFASFIDQKLVDHNFSFCRNVFALRVSLSQSLFQCLYELKLLDNFDNSLLLSRIVFIALFFNILLHLFDVM